MVDFPRKLVGVMIPCFNQGRFLAECIDSLYRQTYPHWRAVVIDDASTDGESPQLCQQATSDRVKVVLLERNLGRALVRNECLKQLGVVDYVLSVDCDDFLSDTFIEKLVPALDSSPRAGIAYGVLHYFGDSGFKPDGVVFPSTEWSRDSMYFENVIPGSQAMFKYECLSQVEGWRKDFTVYSGEDYDIWLQAVEADWEPVWVKDAVYFYRRHANSYMANRDREMGLQIDIRILRHHFKQIKRSVGVERFLNHQVMPAIYAAINAGEIGKGLRLGYPLLKLCPAQVLTLAAKYYSNRLRLRLPGKHAVAENGSHSREVPRLDSK